MVDPCFVGLEKTDRAKRGSLRLCSERKRDERTPLKNKSYRLETWWIHVS